jgi:N-acyl-D-amino-acid deacylase
MRRRAILKNLPAVALLTLVSYSTGADAGEPAQAVQESSDADIKAAVVRGLAALEKAATKYPEHRRCFSCHHQSLPMLAHVVARAHGFSISDQLLPEQLKFSLDSFTRRIEDLRKGQNIGGGGMTVSYGLWAALIAEAPADNTTEAMIEALLKLQRPEGHWLGQTCRPPLEESYQTCTTLAILGLRKYATAAQREATDAAIAKAKAWLAAAPTKGQEDKVSRLWGLHVLEAPPDAISAARDALKACQRADGGWAQLDEMDSDAYATGQTLYILQTTGLDSADPIVRRGAAFLVRTQRSDGAWLVVSRSKPIQPYYDFDDEDPLGKNQFISVPASAWAVAALAARSRAD